MTRHGFKSPWRGGNTLVLEVRDKDRPESDVLGWLLVQKTETYIKDRDDGKTAEGSIRLSFERILPKYSHQAGKGAFCASYSRRSNSVSLTSSSINSDGGVFLDLPGLYGQRVGTYLMNEIVHWVQQWPEANVNTVKLIAGQGQGNNKARRNWFYEQFDLVFDFDDAEHSAGRSRPILAGALNTVETWRKNLVEHQLIDYLASVLYAERSTAVELDARTRACRELLVEQRQAMDSPVRWAIKQLYFRYAKAVFSGMFLAVVVGLIWVRMSSSTN